SSQQELDENVSVRLTANSIAHETLLDETEAKAHVLQSCMANQDVAWGHSWLQSQGYAFVDTNSLVLIEMEYRTDPPIQDDEITRPGLSKQGPEPGHTPILIRADTMVWQAFENPTHDSANHTALLTYWRNGGEPQTIFFELDISDNPPVVLREGHVSSEQFIAGDVGIVDWWGCVVGGLAAAGTLCLFTNCGWGHCVVAGAGAAVVGCTAQAIWNW
ncbi:MAG: hypothetical protein OEV68_18330, partial [candidate division Zixibacteria bacterium]|nr:hypothetical protein [candidate division Zixibacteria bacterium]